MKRRLIYWGIPILGALYGTAVTIYMQTRGKEKYDEYDASDNQMDAFGGIIIWFTVTSVLLSLALFGLL